MRNLLLFCTLFMAVVFAACSKSDDVTQVIDPLPQYKKDTAAIRAYLEANSLDAVKDSSGIFYKIIEPGNGKDSIDKTQQKAVAEVKYTGKLLNGQVFDSTATGKTATFGYHYVIGGFQFAIGKLTKGGRIIVYVPSYFGYGPENNGPIPANSVLIFDVELVNVSVQ
jgi:FKBP-type peptidyl-prolyl cis-trans isomerase FkpA